MYLQITPIREKMHRVNRTYPRDVAFWHYPVTLGHWRINSVLKVRPLGYWVEYCDASNLEDTTMCLNSELRYLLIYCLAGAVVYNKKFV